MRILSYNLQLGGQEQLDAITTVLEAADADIVGLTEADDKAVVCELAQRLKMFHVWARGSGERHIATLSRFPILDWQIHNRKPLTQAALVTTLDYRPYNGSTPLVIYNLHLRPYPLWHFELMRWLATLRLLQIIRRKMPHSHLIIGDFNTYGQGDIDLPSLLDKTGPQMKRQLRWQRFYFLKLVLPTLEIAGYRDCFRQLHPDELGLTYTLQGTLVARPDYIMADAHMLTLLESCQVGYNLPRAKEASDHFPLLASFRDEPDPLSKN